MFRDNARRPILYFLDRDDEAARLIKTRDWSSTALGPIEAWPLHLQSAIGLIIHATVPMAMLWGRDGYLLYNTAYAAFVGASHPGALGRKVREAWPEAAHINDPAIGVALGGKAIAYRNQPLSVRRDGVDEQVWVDLDYSPIPGDDGEPAGVCLIVTDVTRHILGERRISRENASLRTLLDETPAIMALLEGPDHIFRLTNRAIQRLYGGRDVIGRPVREAVPEAEAQGFLRLLDQTYRTGNPFIGKGSSFEMPDAEGRRQVHYVDFIYQPIRNAEGDVYGIIVHGADVTERVLVERALIQREDQARNLSDALIIANNALIANADRRGNGD